MAISSTSTFAEVKAQYLDNADWDVEESLDKAKLFAVACRVLLLIWPKRQRHSQTETEIDPSVLKEQLLSARRFIAANSSGGGTTYASLGDYKDESAGGDCP